MKIIRNNRFGEWRLLREIPSGRSIEFKTAFHPDVQTDDVFIVNEVCSTYRPEAHKHNSFPVTNLRNGKLSYVRGTREVQIVRANVVLENDC